MIKSDWTDYIPGSSTNDVVDLLNDFGWNITYDNKADPRTAFAGDRLLIQTDTQQETEVFLFGMALALEVLPDPIKESIKQFVEDLDRPINTERE